jgi:hypothetical protein
MLNINNLKFWFIMNRFELKVTKKVNKTFLTFLNNLKKYSNNEAGIEMNVQKVHLNT